MSVVGYLHSRFVAPRRARVLGQILADCVPSNAQSLLDVGCGDGRISKVIAKGRPDLSVAGIDVLVRPQTCILVRGFDGKTFPFDDQSIDVVTFIDVLHHSVDPTRLLREGKRVARQAIIIKDHLCDGFLAGNRLRFMDWVGNAHDGISLPYEFWKETRWKEVFAQLELGIDRWSQEVPLYPWPASCLFAHRLQFVARVVPLRTAVAVIPSTHSSTY